MYIYLLKLLKQTRKTEGYRFDATRLPRPPWPAAALLERNSKSPLCPLFVFYCWDLKELVTSLSFPSPSSQLLPSLSFLVTLSSGGQWVQWGFLWFCMLYCADRFWDVQVWRPSSLSWRHLSWSFQSSFSGLVQDRRFPAQYHGQPKHVGECDPCVLTYSPWKLQGAAGA